MASNKITRTFVTTPNQLIVNALISICNMEREMIANHVEACIISSLPPSVFLLLSM